MQFAGFAKVASVVSIAGSILASCVVVEEGPGMRPPPPLGPPPGRGEICTVSMRRFAANVGESARLSETTASQTPKASASFIPENVGERRAGNASLRLARANTGPYVPSDAASDALSAMPAPPRRKDTGQFAQASAVIAAAAAGEVEPRLDNPRKMHPLRRMRLSAASSPMGRKS